MSEVGAEGLLRAANVLSRPAEEFGNDPTLELLWAEKAYQHAEVYFNLLCSVDPLLLRLTPADDEIYQLFRQEFPDMKVAVINEDEMKSPAGKEKWRIFCEKFKDKVEDYSFGTLLRIDCSEDYSPENSTLVTRIQFYAVESARNREGHNSGVRSKYRQKLQDT
ncbi:UNVERIFIED_CONTAM: hypothetical protein PYX00_007535 [Menopon gallinae]|uniref:Polysaccharide biosynthesis domain-containing protein n=1 Tax=Menopon gallinae TaxID=328185 RepID=A0AAW2HJM4_9NEOP